MWEIIFHTTNHIQMWQSNISYGSILNSLRVRLNNFASTIAICSYGFFSTNEFKWWNVFKTAFTFVGKILRVKINNFTIFATKISVQDHSQVYFYDQHMTIYTVCHTISTLHLSLSSKMIITLKNLFLCVFYDWW